MTIQVGDQIPEAKLSYMAKSGIERLNTAEFFKGKRVVLFAVPGAFTPTCSNQHLPGFVTSAAKIKAKGVDVIACMSVNDVFVMNAWGKQSGVGDDVMMLSDGNGDFAKSLGLDFDASAMGMGVRSWRFSMLVDDGKVIEFNREPNPGEAKISGAEKILEQL